MPQRGTGIARSFWAARTAAPGGGAQQWVWGCCYSFILSAICLLTPMQAYGQSGTAAEALPSGQTVTLYEVLVDEIETGSWLRFRYVAPRIARALDDITYETAADDMIHLCIHQAIPYMAEHGLTAEVIVISLSSRETEFGAPNRDVTQFFDAFRVENNTCIWEAF